MYDIKGFFRLRCVWTIELYLWISIKLQGLSYSSHVATAIHVKRNRKKIWLSLTTKIIIPTEMSNRQSENTKTPPKSSIPHRLRAEFGRSVGVTTATQLVVVKGAEHGVRRFKRSCFAGFIWAVLVDKKEKDCTIQHKRTITYSITTQLNLYTDFLWVVNMRVHPHCRIDALVSLLSATATAVQQRYIHVR